MAVKGVIVAAGYGSRFLPVTRCIPKEMLPVGTRPAIDLVVQEMIEAGIEDLLIITSRRKSALDDWFDRQPELEQAFTDAPHKLDAIARPNIRTYFVRQPAMQGTGHALLLAKTFAADDPIVVAYPDDLFIGQPNCTAELIDTYERTGCSVLSAADRAGTDVSRYGVLDVKPVDGQLQVQRFVEKPAPGTEPSHLVSLGRFLFTPDFFVPLLAGLEHHTGGEYYHVHALNTLAAENRLMAKVIAARHLDTGAPEGYLRAVVEAGLADPEGGEAFRAWLSERLA